MQCTAVGFLFSKSPRPRSVLHSGFRGLKHARVSCSIDAYTPEEAPADEPNYLLTYTDSFPNRQRCQLLLHCTDAIVIPVDSLAELRQNLSPLMKEALQPSTNPARIIKLFIAITNSTMLFENRKVYECVNSLWSTMAALGQASLSDYFEVCFLGLSQTCLYTGMEGSLRDCADASSYMRLSASGGGHEAHYGSTVPGPFYAGYVSKLLEHIQMGGSLNKQAILGELMQPVCDQLALRVHQHVSQGYWERFATSVLPLKTIKQYATEAVRIAVKEYNNAAAAYFPYTQPSTEVLNPEQTAVLQILKASREALVAPMLLDLVVVPQSKVVATFLLAYFYECLGLTAVDTHPGEARSQNPFDSAAQPLQQQATSRHLWRSLKISERRAVMYAWGVVKGPTARMALVDGGHSAIVTDCTKAREAIRVSGQILKHSMQQLHSMCMSIRVAPGGAPSPPADTSSHWQSALVADLKSTMQQAAHSLLDDVVLAARGAVNVLPLELQEMVMVKLELHRAPQDQHWCYRLA